MLSFNTCLAMDPDEIKKYFINVDKQAEPVEKQYKEYLCHQKSMQPSKVQEQYQRPIFTVSMTVTY